MRRLGIASMSSAWRAQDIEAALAKAAASHADVLLAGGGDGTASAAAGMLMGKKKALAILPAGTMNLVARGLGIPLSLDGAVQAFAEGEVMPIDVASANGHPFIHQFSIGMHAKMVDLRDKMTFGSRLGKMRASMRASLATLLDPPSLKVLLKVGDAEIMTRATAISITNNLFGEGHLPYADQPDGGVLGVYVTVARERGQLLRFFLNCRARALARQSACRDPRGRKGRAEAAVAGRESANASLTASCCRWRARPPWKFTRRC